MNTRPKIKPELKPVDKLLDILSILLLVAMWSLVLYGYSTLPETIATHFDASGNVNGHGSKATLFILPGIGTGMFFLFILLNRAPHMFNYPITITGENAARQYALATRLIRLLNTGILLSFAVIVYGIINIGNGISIGMWMLPMILIITTIPVVWYFVAARKAG